MKLRSAVIASATALVAAGAIAGASIGPATAGHASTKDVESSFTLIEHPGKTTNVNTNPKGHIGDQFIFTNTLTFQGDHVGRDQGVCTLTTPNSAACDVTLIFANLATKATPKLSQPAELTVQGVLLFKSNPNVLPVAGGSTAFEGATGQVTATDLPHNKTRLHFEITQPSPDAPN